MSLIFCVHERWESTAGLWLECYLRVWSIIFQVILCLLMQNLTCQVASFLSIFQRPFPSYFLSLGFSSCHLRTLHLTFWLGSCFTQHLFAFLALRFLRRRPGPCLPSPTRPFLVLSQWSLAPEAGPGVSVRHKSLPQDFWLWATKFLPGGLKLQDRKAGSFKRLNALQRKTNRGQVRRHEASTCGGRWGLSVYTLPHVPGVPEV